MTWATWETAERRPQEHNYAGVEKALQWEPRSVEHILAGGEPVRLSSTAGMPAEVKDLPEDLQELIELYYDRVAMTDHDRETLLSSVRITIRGLLAMIRERTPVGQRRTRPVRRRAG